MSLIRITHAQRRALLWFADQVVPVGMFGAGEPSRAIRKTLETKGWIWRRLPTGRVGLVKYELSPAGRALVEQIKAKQP